MGKLPHKTFGTSGYSSREKRLAYFSPDIREILARRKETLKDRGEVISDFRKQSDKIAKRADDIAQNSTDDATGRAYAPEVDVSYAEALTGNAIERLNVWEQNRELPVMTRKMITECKKLQALFPGKRGVEGLVFEFDGANLSVTQGDTTMIGAAIEHVEGKKKGLTAAPGASLERDVLHESIEDFNKRVAAQERRAAELQRYSAGARTDNLGMWNTILDALRSFKSEFAAMEAIRDDLNASPDKLREYEKAKPEVIDTFKKKRPMAYIQLLCDAAKRDPSILQGREDELVGTRDGAGAEQMHLFLQMIDETTVEQPGAIRYYPDRLKRIPTWVEVENDRNEQFPGEPSKHAGLPHYRREVSRLVSEDPTLFTDLVLREYTKYWTKDAVGALGEPDQLADEVFSDTAVRALTADTSIFWKGERFWNPSGKPEMASAIMSTLSIEAKAKLFFEANDLSKQMMLYNLDENGWKNTVKELVTRGNDEGMQMLLKNDQLILFMYNADKKIYKQLIAVAKKSKNIETQRMIHKSAFIRGKE